MVRDGLKMRGGNGIMTADESRLERQFRRQCRICDSLGLKRMLEILKEEMKEAAPQNLVNPDNPSTVDLSAELKRQRTQ